MDPISEIGPQVNEPRLGYQLNISERLNHHGNNFTKNTLPEDNAGPLIKTTLTFVDLFAGCGGLSLGLEQAGFEPLLFSELNMDAAATYTINRPNLNIPNYADVNSLNDDEIKQLKEKWKSLGIYDVDLVCGGPPCQGYSGIGHRRSFSLNKEEIPSNHLFKEMVRIIYAIRPKMFLFENVQGLLASRWTKNGQAGEVFRDVLRSLYQIEGYNVRWQLVYAKDYGIPQNRPRVLVVGVREDILLAIPEVKLDSHGLPTPSAIKDGILPLPTYDPPNLVDVLGDLVDPNYIDKASTLYYVNDAENEFQRMMRTIPTGKLLRKGDLLLEQEYSRHSARIVEKYKYMIENNGELLPEMKTKKFAQRVIPKVWGTSGPNITATSLPEDYVHYEQPRGLTVREWARLQTFPDWYQFCGSRTTGGRRRAGDPDKGIWERDVPKYTQIGNAVPVMLSRAIGKHFVGILQGALVKH